MRPVSGKSLSTCACAPRFLAEKGGTTPSIRGVAPLGAIVVLFTLQHSTIPDRMPQTDRQQNQCFTARHKIAQSCAVVTGGFEGHEDHRTPFASIRGKGIRVRGLRNRRNRVRFRLCSDAGVDFGWGRQPAVGINPNRRRFAGEDAPRYWFGKIIGGDVRRFPLLGGRTKREWKELSFALRGERGIRELGHGCRNGKPAAKRDLS